MPASETRTISSAVRAKTGPPFGVGGAEGEDDLASSAHTWMAAVTRLDLSNHRLGNDGVALLAGSPAAARLRYLNLSSASFDEDLGPAAAVALASSPHLSRLRTLDLARNKIGVEGVAAIADSPARTA